MGHLVITVDVQLTFRDLFKASYAIRFQTIRFRGTVAIVGIMLLSVLVENIVFIRHEILWLGYLLPLAYLAIVLAQSYYGVKSQWAQTPSWAENKHYTLTDEILRMDSLSSAEEYKWVNYVKLTTTKDFFLLFENERAAVVFPFKSFASVEEREAFREFVLTHLSNEKITLIKSSKRRLFLLWILILLLNIIFVFLVIKAFRT